MKSLGPVSSERTCLAISVHAELLSVGALLATLGRRDRLLCSGGESNSAKSTRKFAFLRLVLSVAARSAQVNNLVEILTDGASFCNDYKMLTNY